MAHMAVNDITREEVLAAIELYDSPEGQELIRELHYGKSLEYRLIHEGRFYPSKPIVGLAHGMPEGREYLDSGRVDGGITKNTAAANILSKLKFFVDPGWLHMITELQPHRSHQRVAAYQYVVLLWAIARTRSMNDADPRLIPFTEARRQLTQLLRPFAIAKTTPDPVMPWIALQGPLWELDLPEGLASVSEAQVKQLDISGGLTEGFEHFVRGWQMRDAGLRATVEVISVLIGNNPDYAPLLHELGLPETDIVPVLQPREAASSPEMTEAVAAVERVANPRRKTGRSILTRAESVAIEDRAVELTREYLEQHYGYATEDVGKTESYDVHATKGGQVVKVEVKGTTGDGAKIVLTRNEVALHRDEFPNNALAIVRYIDLDRSGDTPTANGGTIELIMPFALDLAGLDPIAYDYTTGL